jgi:uncharacterized protein with PIN domain/sulfur carrier protein ThiS
MSTAKFRFHGNLREFLPSEMRSIAFAHPCARAATLKNAIEALGVPHTEAARILVNGTPATLDRIVREGDAVEVFPWQRQPLAEPPRFLADAHLGGLARFLRMLGFDTLHRNDFADETIRSLATLERRVVLTRDRELLKCRDIFLGCYVRELKVEAQLREVASRFGLAACARPFTLCLACNVALEPATEAQARAYAPHAKLDQYREFRRCGGCQRIYWEGSHFQRMRAALGQMLAA